MILIEPKDKFELKIEDATFIVSPYSKKQQLEIEKCVRMEKGEEVIDIDKQMDLVFKFCIKEIKGVKKPDGSDFKFEFNENGELIQDHIDAIRMSVKASRVYTGMIALRMGQLGQVKNSNGEDIGIEIKYLGN